MGSQAETLTIYLRRVLAIKKGTHDVGGQQSDCTITNGQHPSEGQVALEAVKV